MTDKDLSRWTGTVDARLDGIEGSQGRIEGKLDQLVTEATCQERHGRLEATVKDQGCQLDGLAVTSTEEKTKWSTRWALLLSIGAALLAVGSLMADWVGVFKG